MLSPSDRKLLLECLRPPSGYRLDQAIGTTFSLDLLALLTAPLAFTFFDWEDESGEITADPLALLEAIRRQADRITIYCQAGEIKLPPASQRLNAYLENCVVEVTAPRGGAFHPKLWLLRFVADKGPVQMRLVCLSRNLTFDRSWDVVVVLDGEVIDRKLAFSANNRLGDLIEALPGMAVKPAGDQATQVANLLANEVRRTKWELPEDVEDVLFWPLGLNGRDQWPFAELAGRATLAISPFVSDGLINRFRDTAGELTLVSRPEELAKLSPDAVSACKSVYAFDPQTDELESATESGEAPALSGLHAKVYVVDDGWRGRILLGSANATNAAFGKNVELLVELAGSKKLFGIEAMLAPGQGKQVGLMDMLQPWTSGAATVDPAEVERQKLEERLDNLKYQIAGIALQADVNPSKTDQFSVLVRSAVVLPDLEGARLRCWPSTLRSERAIELSGQAAIDLCFDALTLDALTGFFAFELELSSGGQTVAKRFVRTVAVAGMPADRLSRLLASLLQDKEQLMRLLWLLLESQGAAAMAEGEGDGVTSWMPWSSDLSGGYPLFERILKALATDPTRIREIGRLIEDLSRTPDAAKILPAGLLNLWQAVKAAELGGSP